MELRTKFNWILILVTLQALAQITGEGLRLPDQQVATVPQQNVQQLVFHQQPQQQQQQQQLQQPQLQQPQLQQPQLQQPQLQQPQLQQAGFAEVRGRSSLLGSLFGLGQDNDPYLARTNTNCLSGDLSECFKTQALNTFDEIFYRDQYRFTDFARIVRMPETQQRSLLQEPFEYSDEPKNEDDDWNQLLKYALRRAERFIKSTALEVDVPEEFTEAGRYDARFIGNDIDSELDVIEDKHIPSFSRKKLKKMIIPLILVLKIFKLKLLLFLPFILGIIGLKKILGLAAIILPGLFAYFKLCRPQGGASGFGGGFGGGLGGLFGSKTNVPEYSPQGVGAANYYHHHDHYENQGQNGGSQFYRQDPAFSKPYTDYYSKNYQQEGTSNAVSFGDTHAHEAAYSGGYYGRSSGKDVQSTQKS